VRLIATDLSFGFRSEAALFSAINLTLNERERVAIVGSNASGKTTLLRLLAGLLQPRTGQIEVDGANSTHHRDFVGIVFQNPDHQMLTATVESEIALGLELRGMPARDMQPRVADMMQRFNLNEFKDVPPHQLSGGQKQRVALAAIMVSRPRFLLLDEPDSFLDAPSRRALLAAISEFCADCGLLWTAPNAAKIPPVDRILRLTSEGLVAA
jgi:energy-coupling factor transporter ATP-binding protein EcfA2